MISSVCWKRTTQEHYQQLTMTNEDTNILSEFPNHMGRTPIYPWEQWTDGQIRELVQGEDFYSEATSFRTLIHRTARRRGLKAKTRISDDKKSVIVAFYKEIN
jgi:hypothetical protein